MKFYLGDVDADGNVSVPAIAEEYGQVIIGDINLASYSFYSMFLSRSDVKKFTINKADKSAYTPGFPYTEVQPGAFRGCQNLVEMHLGQYVMGLRIYYETVQNTALQRITLASDSYYAKSYYQYLTGSDVSTMTKAFFSNGEEMVSKIKEIQKNMTLTVGNV